MSHPTNLHREQCTRPLSCKKAWPTHLHQHHLAANGWSYASVGQLQNNKSPLKPWAAWQPDQQRDVTRDLASTNICILTQMKHAVGKTTRQTGQLPLFTSLYIVLWAVFKVFHFIYVCVYWLAVLAAYKYVIKNRYLLYHVMNKKWVGSYWATHDYHILLESATKTVCFPKEDFIPT